MVPRGQPNSVVFSFEPMDFDCFWEVDDFDPYAKSIRMLATFGNGKINILYYLYLFIVYERGSAPQFLKATLLNCHWAINMCFGKSAPDLVLTGKTRCRPTSLRCPGFWILHFLRRHKKKHEGLRKRCSNRGLEPESNRLWASHARPETFDQQRQPIKP